MANKARTSLKAYTRILIKIGSRVLSTKNGLNYRVIERLCDDLSLLKDSGKEFAIVSSGAIAAGSAIMPVSKKFNALSKTQALAAIGQGSLIRAYNDAFRRYGHVAAQVLMTREDIDNRRRYLNIRNTFTALFEFGAVPIVNENDTVSVDEIQFTDNDLLSAMIIPAVEAQVLIVLTDIDGVYPLDPRIKDHGQRITEIIDIKPKDINASSSEAGEVGRGGIKSKLQAAYRASLLGVPTVIASAYQPQVVSSILAGDDVGTIILPGKSRKLTQKDHWISFVSRPKGKLVVDNGAMKMIMHKGKSLLPCGVVDVEGNFKAGDPITIGDSQGRDIAVGLSNYSSDEVYQIKGANTKDLCAILSKECDEEVVHRNNMIVKKETP
ncbi:MAG: glutamate 5-kinase [Deltaproteobacteria bacterium]|nr:glutamate 5-kinase [Deltaproteobacteria bacterium]